MTRSVAEILQLDTGNPLQAQGINLQDLALILKRLPNSLIQLRLDEVIVNHIANELKDLGIEFDKDKFFTESLTNDEWRNSINHNGQRIRKAAEYFPCQKCKKQFVDKNSLETHNCVPVAPIVQRGRLMIDLNKL